MAGRALAQEEDVEVNLTPLLDIVFIMLIFFIVTATFVRELGLDVSKSRNSHRDPKEKVRILIRIDSNSQIWFGDQAVDVRRVRANIEKLLAQQPYAPVIIQPAKQSKTGRLVKVMDAARQAGTDNISIAEQRPS